MRTIIRKAYYNYEKEEEWLNEMSAKGFALIDYTWCRYVFEDCSLGEYIYRIDLLEKLPTNPESRKYLLFMEESGVEHVASYMRWVYFKKKLSDGPFDIYSDIDSKIKHNQRINSFWTALAIMEFALAILEFANGFNWLINEHGSPYYLLFTFGFILTAFGFLLITLGHSIRKRIKRLKKEKEIRE